MKAKGNGLLKLTGILEILIGIASIAMTLWMLSSNPADFVAFNVEEAHKALWVLVAIYGIAAFQILAGIVALVVSNKPAKATLALVFGFLLLLLQALFIGKDGFVLTAMVVNGLLLIVPILYIVGAVLNKKSILSK